MGEQVRAAPPRGDRVRRPFWLCACKFTSPKFHLTNASPSTEDEDIARARYKNEKYILEEAIKGMPQDEWGMNNY
jgi:hypothetical protein